MNNDYISITLRYDVGLPPVQEAIMIPVQELTFLQRKIERIESPFSIYQTLLGVALGIGPSAVFAALTATSKTIRVVCWTAFVASLLFSVLIWRVIQKERRNIKQSKKDLLEEMARIEKLYRRPSGRGTVDDQSTHSQRNMA